MFSAQNERTMFVATVYTTSLNNAAPPPAARLNFTCCISESLLEHFYRTSNRKNGMARMIACIKSTETLFGGRSYKLCVSYSTR